MKERRKEMVVRSLSAGETKEKRVIKVGNFTVLVHRNWCYPQCESHRKSRQRNQSEES